MSKFIDLVIRGKDLFSSKSDSAADSIGSLKTEIKSLDKQLKETEAAQENIKVFKELSTESEQLTQALDESKASLTAYTNAQTASAVKLEKTAQSANELKLNSKELTAAYKAQSTELVKNESSLSKASTKMRDYASTVDSTEKAIKETNTQYQNQKQNLEKLTQEYQSSKKPVDDLNNSYKVSKAQLSALEQVQKKQVAELEKTKANYQQSADEVARLSTSQAELKTSLQSTTTTLSKVNGELVDLKKTQVEANQSLEASTRNYKASASATATLEKNLKTVNTQLGKTETKLKQSAIDTNNLGDATNKLAAKQKTLVTETKKAYSSLAQMSSQLTGMKKGLNTFGTGVGSVTKQLLAMGGAYVGIRTLWTSLKQFVSVGAQFDTFRKQFEGIMGSVSEGEYAFEWVKDFARDTPLDMAQVTQAFIVLKGAGLDPMEGSLLALTNATAKYTGGTDKLENITRQLSQAWAKGKISAEDMQSAVENGLPVWTLLAQATGKTVGELRNLSEQGKLGRYELRLLFAELQSDAPGAAAKLMQTFSGQMAVARFNIQDFLDTVAQSGALDFLMTQLVGLNAQVTAMADDGSLKIFAQEMSDRFVEMGKAVSSTVGSLVTNLNDFTSKISKGFAASSLVINTFTLGIKSLVAISASAFSLFLLGLSQITSAFGTLENPISRGQKAASEFFATLRDEALKQASVDAQEFQTALNTLSSSATKASDSTKSVTAAAKEATTTIQPLGNVLNATSQEALNMANNILASGNELEKAGVPADRLKATVEALVNKLKEDPSPYVQQIVKRLQAQYISLGDTVVTSTDKSKKSLQELEASFKNAGGESLDNLKENAKNALEIFQGFSDAKKPVNELKQAFTTLLAAEVELAKATGETLSSTLAVTAAQLGLSDAFSTASSEVDRNNAVMNGTIELYDRLINKQKNLQNVNSNSTKNTEKQKQAQEKLNIANEKAASHAGANIAFQKLWNEAKERSLQLYDLLSLSTEQLTEKTKDLSQSLRDSFRNQSWSSILAPINDLNNLAKQNELQAIAQTKAYNGLFKSLEDGTVPLSQLNSLANGVGDSFNQLSETNLSALNAQIEKAKAATNSLKNELSDTVHSLKNELDELEGNQAQVLERDYKADKLELEQQLKEAEKSGDASALSDARESLNIAKEIYNIRSKAIVTEQKENIETAKTVSESSNVNTNVSEVKTVQEINYTVTFSLNGRSSTFSSNTATNVEQLMTALAESGFTVTRA